MKYEFPEKDPYDDWVGRHHIRTFVPDARQQLVLDAVQAALDMGLYYTSAVREECAARLGLTPEQLDANFKTRVEGGRFGMDLYYARDVLDRRHLAAQEDAAAEALNVHVGQKLGTIMFNDFKRCTGTQVVQVDGRFVKVQFRRGVPYMQVQVTPLQLKYAIDRAAERKLRKDNFDAFVAKQRAAAAAA